MTSAGNASSVLSPRGRTCATRRAHPRWSRPVVVHTGPCWKVESRKSRQWHQGWPLTLSRGGWGRFGVGGGSAAAHRDGRSQRRAGESSEADLCRVGLHHDAIFLCFSYLIV